MDDDQAGAVTFQGDGIPVESEPVQEDAEPLHFSDKTETETANSTHGEAVPASSPSAMLEQWTDKALHFLSHASNETLGACLVGLGATTYLVLGRVGLVIIGVAGGVVLHATWEGIRGDLRDEWTQQAETERRQGVGVDIMKRVLDLRTSKNANETREDTKIHASQAALDFSSFEPETALALNTFVDAVIQDYVYYWYGPQLPGEEGFPVSCRKTLTAFMLSLSGHLQRKRAADVFLDFVTNASSILIVFLNELSAAMGASPNATPLHAIATYLKLKPGSSLVYIINEESQNQKLASSAEDMLQAYLDSKAYNCEPVHVFLKQVLAQLVLGSTVTLCSRPEWINEWVVYGLEESETTKEVMDIVDAGVEAGQTEQASQQANQRQQATSKKEAPTEHVRPEHKRQPSRAEQAMDDAMQEAKRLTQMMIEEDERRAKEEGERHTALSSSEDVSDAATQGVDTPTSSQSDRERQEEEISSWTTQTPSGVESVTSDSRPTTPGTAKHSFTSFDQLVPTFQPTALSDSPSRAGTSPSPAQLTLYNARMSIFDDSQPGERTIIKAKPTIDYLIQIEPSSSAFPGWMIARKYADFEMLHEVLRRLSVITGVRGFNDTHAELPRWKSNTKSSLRSELERYLTDAVRYQPLAESEGMRRFLEKEQGLAKTPGGAKGAFAWPTPDAFGKFGDNMVNVLAKAPKQVAGGVAGGGKAMFGGVTGLVGGVVGAGKKSTPSQSPGDLSRTSTHQSRTSVNHTQSNDSYAGSATQARQSQDSLRTPARPSLDRHRSSNNVDHSPRPSTAHQRSSFETSRYDASIDRDIHSPTGTDQALDALTSPTKERMDKALPPPPSEMPEDYGSAARSTRSSGETFRSSKSFDQRRSDEREVVAPPQPPRPKQKPEAKPKEPITEQETSVAVELMFAVITELYTLSSAWNIRRTLLAAAKTYLLRPGNPQLLTIRDMLQTSMLDNNLSDSGIAGHIYKMRENALPTEEEMKVWVRDYPEKTDEQKEELRIKARALLVTNGMPQALSSVMGAAASGEALGKVFDCLQLPEVSRGLIFGMMLQAIKVVTH